MTGTQALAERLREWPFLEKPDELAEAILFDGSVYLTPAEAARVAAIEEAARAFSDDLSPRSHAALRTALETKP
jgi:hypothetical protein